MQLLVSMSYTTGITGRDCVIVALSNFFGKDYETVLRDVYRHCNPIKENHFKAGFFESTYKAVMSEYLNRPVVESHPRRGQDKITGIVKFCRPNRKSGHLVAVIDGTVFEVDGKMYPIIEYRRLFGYNLKGVWQ